MTCAIICTDCGDTIPDNDYFEDTVNLGVPRCRCNRRLRKWEDSELEVQADE